MTIKNLAQHRRKKIQARKRSKLLGNSERPRLAIYKSNTAFYVQAVDDTQGHTLLALDTRKIGKRNKESVAKLGQELTTQLQNKNIKQIRFDCSGYLYHGLVKHFAETLHQSGLKP